MQTFPSHAIMGIVVAEVCIATGLMDNYGRLVVWSICFLGAITPDMVMVPMFLRDKLQGRHPMTKQGPLMMTLKEISHSIPVWLILFGITISLMHEGVVRNMSTLFLIAGIVGGVIPDIPTHSKEQFRETDCTFLYPFGALTKTLIGIDTLRWKSDRWEYRFDHGVLWPLKEWEKRFNIGAATAIIILIFFG
jgi:hypothetical protein